MHDLQALRKNPQEYDRNWQRRGLSAQTPVILALDEQRRGLQTQLQQLQQQRNEKSKEIGVLKAKGGGAQGAMDAVATMKTQMAELEVREQEVAAQLNDVLSALPNLLAEDVPDGRDESMNVEVRKFGDPARRNDNPDHVDIGERLGMLDFAVAAKVAGARFSVVHSGLARLERALAQFMLDTHTQEHGYTEVNPPLLVNDDAMYGTTQLPKFRDDQFGTTDGRWLIPTSEVVLTNLVREEILDAGQLPLRLTAYTPCFRKEAGSAGRDTRGMIRQHQFYKVEMVSIVRPEDSEAEHQRMVACAENILKKLELPFRTMMLCAGDTGFAARKTYDLEVWLPAQNKFREISSCSNCGDMQARRMQARSRVKGDKATEFVHTLNGSGVAVGRALVAVMENYYDAAAGTLMVPEALRPYMGGIKEIEALPQALIKAGG